VAKCSDWHRDRQPVANTYGNAQKPYLKGGAAWFLGTKYYSEQLQFKSPARWLRRMPSQSPGAQSVAWAISC
jgi:hypothetical protein